MMQHISLQVKSSTTYTRFDSKVKDKEKPMSEKKVADPLHGVTLEMILTSLVESYGWETLGARIDIRCFTSNPSVKSSLKFLRRTPWARKKVEEFYLSLKK